MCKVRVPAHAPSSPLRSAWRREAVRCPKYPAAAPPLSWPSPAANALLGRSRLRMRL